MQVLCKEGRIPGLIVIGRTGGIPDDAEKPTDAIIISGKYIKKLKMNDGTERLKVKDEAKDDELSQMIDKDDFML